jgi:hypothetical protein
MLFAGVAMANTVDPQLFVGPPGTNARPSGDPNLITGPGFSVGVAGNHTMQDPLLVIFGHNLGSTGESLEFTGCMSTGSPKATVGTYGLTTNSTTLSAGQDAYTRLGLPDQGSGTVDHRHRRRLRRQ